MALRDDVPMLLALWRENKERIAVNSDLFDMHGGDIIGVCERWIDTTFVVARARERMKQNLSPINIVKKVTDKLSAAYDYGVSRTVTGGTQALLDEYITKTRASERLSEAWEMKNLCRDSLIQLFVDGDYTRSRVIASHQFVVWSTDTLYPNKVTGVMVFAGYRRDSDGKARICWTAWTEEEVWSFDEDGKPVPALMAGNEDGINLWGIIPFVYLTGDSMRVMPKPDKDFRAMARLLPMQVTNLNYAAEYQSHSIVAIFNGPEKAKFDRNPDAIWMMQSEGGDDPSIEVLSPKVDIEGCKGLILSQVSMFLSMRGIRPGAISSDVAEVQLSGVSKIVDEADATQLVLRQQQDAVEVEREYWSKLAIIHDAAGLPGRWGNTVDSLSVEFGKPELIPDQSALTDVLSKQMEQNLITREFALRRLYPHMTEDQRQEMLLEAKPEPAPAPVIQEVVVDERDTASDAPFGA